MKLDPIRRQIKDALVGEKFNADGKQYTVLEPPTVHSNRVCFRAKEREEIGSFVRQNIVDAEFELSFETEFF